MIARESHELTRIVDRNYLQKRKLRDHRRFNAERSIQSECRIEWAFAFS
jgi:hypothetical protein